MDITPELATAIFWNSDAPIGLSRRLGNAYIVRYAPAQVLPDFENDHRTDFGGFVPSVKLVAVQFTVGLVMVLDQRWFFIHCGDHVIVPPFPADNLPYLAGMEPDDVRLPGDAG